MRPTHLPNHRIYRNLTKSCVSYQARVPEHNLPWHVREHLGDVFITHPRFHVEQKGPDRVRATGRKHVHAYIYSQRAPEWDNIPAFVQDLSIVANITYDPYRHRSFMYRPPGGKTFNQPIRGADWVYVRWDGTMFAANPFVTAGQAI